MSNSSPAEAWPEPSPLSEVLAEKPSGGSATTRVIDFTVEEAGRAALASQGIPALKNVPLGTTSALNMPIKENTNHRVVAMLWAQGGTAKTVFSDLGGEFDKAGDPIPGTGLYSLDYIRQLRRLPWFQELILEIIDNKGGDAVANRLQLEVASSIETLVQIRDNEDASASARLNAANSLLDRYLGKPIQAVKVEAPVTVDSYEGERQRLEQELLRLEEQSKHLGGENHLTTKNDAT